MYFFRPSTTLCWPISHHLLWLTLFWRSSTMTLLPRCRQMGTHKADGCDNSLHTLSGPWKGGWNKGVMEKGRKPSSHSARDGFSRWHPVAPDLKTEGKPQTVMGDGAPEMHKRLMYLCVYVSPCTSPTSTLFSWLLRAQGEKGIALSGFKPFFFLLE